MGKIFSTKYIVCELAAAGTDMGSPYCHLPRYVENDPEEAKKLAKAMMKDGKEVTILVADRQMKLQENWVITNGE